MVTSRDLHWLVRFITFDIAKIISSRGIQLLYYVLRIVIFTSNLPKIIKKLFNVNNIWKVKTMTKRFTYKFAFVVRISWVEKHVVNNTSQYGNTTAVWHLLFQVTVWKILLLWYQLLLIVLQSKLYSLLFQKPTWYSKAPSPEYDFVSGTLFWYTQYQNIVTLFADFFFDF